MKRKLWIILAAIVMFTAFRCTAATAASETGDYFFALSPYVTDYNSSRGEYTVKWQTNFRPVKVEIYKRYEKYGGGYTYYLHDTRSDLNNFQATIKLSVDDLPDYFFIRPYYGTGTDQYISSDPLALVSYLRFELVSMKHDTENAYHYNLNWSTNFTPKRIKIRVDHPPKSYGISATIAEATGIRSDSGTISVPSLFNTVPLKKFYVDVYYTDDLHFSCGEFFFADYYHVWFDHMDGTVEHQLVAYGHAPLFLNQPEREGHLYEGCYYEPSFINRADLSTPIYEDTTYYARFVPPCTVTFDLNGRGSPQPEPQVLPFNTPGTHATRPADPTAYGYTFGGWYMTPDCTGTPYNFGWELGTSEIRLYAKWIRNKISGSISITGSVKYFGDTLYTELSGAVADIPSSSLHYQWMESTNRESWPYITGATSSYYETPSNGTSVRFYRVRLTADGYDGWLLSDPRAVNVPHSASPIDGTVSVIQSSIYQTVYSMGGKVTATYRNPDGVEITSSVVHYCWQISEDDVNWDYIPGATSNTYTPVDDDELKYLRVEVSVDHMTGVIHSESKQISYRNTWYTITKDLQGHGVGTTSESVSVMRGNYWAGGVSPYETGWFFRGWFMEPECINEYPYNQEPVLESFTVYAKWIEEVVEHDLLYVPETPPTCSRNGNRAYYICRDCFKMFEDERAHYEIHDAEKVNYILPATGHDWGDWEVTVEPGYETLGIETRRCNNDESHFETRVIPAIGIPLTEDYFPDAVFRSVVTQKDTDGNGYLSLEEREAVTKLNCANQRIVTFVGIEYFPELTELPAINNPVLEDLDVRMNTKLQKLTLNNSTALTSLDFSQNPEMNYIQATNCGAVTVDVTNCPQLTYLNVTGNPVTELDLSGNPLLEKLYLARCSGLTVLDLSRNPALSRLYTYFSGIHVLGISENPNLIAAYGGTLNTTSQYDEYKSGDYTMQLNFGTRLLTGENGMCGNDVYWEKNGSTLTITGTGPMWDYTWSGHSPFYYDSDITTVIIEDGVTSIGAFMFHGCPNLASVSIPDSVGILGSSAFTYCSALDNVTVPYGVRSIPGTFSHCTSLSNITLPDTVTSFGPAAFMDCKSLTSLDFVPDTVTRIQYNAFSGCTGLTTVYLPRGITAIEDYFFRDCTNLVSVAIHKNITRIYKYVFDGCTSLQSVFYEDVRASWNAIDINEAGNEPLLNAQLYCKSAVVFDSRGGTEVPMQALDWEEPAAEPSDPMKYGSLFSGWYTDASCTGEPYDFTAPVYGDITLYAGWITPEPLGILKLPADLTTIEEQAFLNVAAQGVIIPDTVTTIAGSAFRDSAVRYIYGCPGSEAEDFAADHPSDFIFVPVDDDWIANH